MIGKVDVEKNKEDFKTIREAIYDFCFNERCHNTFRARDIARITGFSNTMVGRHFLPFFIEEGLIEVFSRGSHATRYIIIRDRWKKFS